MAELLFSKHRPVVFDDVVGHSTIVSEFKKRSKENTIPHCIFIEGKTGTGKNCLEKIISRAILCQHKDSEGNPCNVCPHCKTVLNEDPSSFYLLHNASNIGVDEMRAIEETANTKTLSTAKHKVIVIDEFQEMANSAKAQKALLKVIEKHSSYTYFILLSMDASKVPDAVKNRSVTYKLKDISVDDIATQLYNICLKENVDVSTEESSNVLITIAENSYGSMRTAISYLERAINSNLWTVDDVREELQLISNTDMINSINKLFKGDSSALNIKYTKDVVERLRGTLSLIHKSVNDVELQGWQKKQLAGLDKFNKDLVEYALSKLFTLLQFPYQSQELIDFLLVDILVYNKKNYSSKVELKEDAPVRRRGQ